MAGGGPYANLAWSRPSFRPATPDAAAFFGLTAKVALSPWLTAKNVPKSIRKLIRNRR